MNYWTPVGQHLDGPGWTHPSLSVGSWGMTWQQYSIAWKGLSLCTLLRFLTSFALNFHFPFSPEEFGLQRKVVNLHTVSVTSCPGAEIAKGTMLTQHKTQQPFFLTTSKISGCALSSGRCRIASLQSSDLLSHFLGCGGVCSDKCSNTEVKLTLVSFTLFQPLSADRWWQSFTKHRSFFRTDLVSFCL